MDVDLILLSRELSPPRADVWEGIAAQDGVNLIFHRWAGTPGDDDPNRWATIARARNAMRRIGSAPLVMYLDDDVVLGPGCVATLAQALLDRARFAALAADSAGEMGREWEHWDYPSHVGMAAVMFRRERLAGITFRWENDRCECLCCCDDLRTRRQGIGYLAGALAWHRPSEPSAAAAGVGGQGPGRILAAFDRRDHHRFRTQFMTTLREAGNNEHVWAFAYGLYPSELERLSRVPGLTVIAIPANGVCPALRRLRDFHDLVAGWPEDTPVAYWDAGDILFQSRISPLWDLVAENPGKLLAVEEPVSHPENPVIRTWSDYIIDPVAREESFEIMATHVFLNSGFLAGTPSALLGYFREGDRLLNSPALHGVGDWGDQPALNLYCHTHPGSWKPIDRGWNFTLAGQEREGYRIALDGHAWRENGQAVHVLHGNSGTLRWLGRSAWGPAARHGQSPPRFPAIR